MTNTHNAPTDTVMIKRRMNCGARHDQSVAKLAELRRTVSTQNLPTALAYEGFITTARAERMQIGATS
jgi:hypothetical protein